MKHATTVLFTLALAALTAACNDAETTGDTGTGGGAPDAHTLTLQTPEFDVPPGDSFECFYMDYTTDRELAVDAATGSQALGGHHITVYFTDVAQAPTHHPCDDAEMENWHQIVGASANGEPVLEMPPGVAFKVPAGKQLVMQAHYINNSNETMTGVRDTINIHLVDPADVVEYLNLFALYDGGFQIAPNSAAESVTECVVDRDLNVINYFGHLHELGKHFKLEEVDESGNVLKVLYETDWKEAYASHPPIERFPLEDPYFVPKGTRLRQSCSWNNTTSETVEFPREMCVGLMYFFPDTGFDLCPGVPVSPPTN